MFGTVLRNFEHIVTQVEHLIFKTVNFITCLLYTSDAADE